MFFDILEKGIMEENQKDKTLQVIPGIDPGSEASPCHVFPRMPDRGPA